MNCGNTNEMNHVTITVNRNLSNAQYSPKKWPDLKYTRNNNNIIAPQIALNPWALRAEPMGLNPVKALKNLFWAIFHNCLNCNSLQWSHIYFVIVTVTPEIQRFQRVTT